MTFLFMGSIVLNIYISAVAKETVRVMTTDNVTFSSCFKQKEFRAADYSSNEIFNGFADRALKQKVINVAVNISGVNLVKMIGGPHRGSDIFAESYICDSEAMYSGQQCYKNDAKACFDYAKFYRIHEHQYQIKEYVQILKKSCEKNFKDACNAIDKEVRFEKFLEETCSKGDGRSCLLFAVRSAYSHENTDRADKFANRACKLHSEGCGIVATLKNIKNAHNVANVKLEEKSSDELINSLNMLGTIEDSYRDFK